MLLFIISNEITISGSLNSMTRLVLVNALYFKGFWLHKFNPNHTKQRTFYLGSISNKTDVPMMVVNNKFRTGQINELDATVLELPYKVNIAYLYL